MPRWMSRVRGRGSERGAVAVETAFVSLLFIAILVGIIETSFLMRDWLGVSAASRAGARMGSSEPRFDLYDVDSADQVASALTGMDPARIRKLWVYRADTTTGATDAGGFSGCTTCSKFVWNAATKKFDASSRNWAASSQNACGADATRNALGVYVEYEHRSPLGLMFNGLLISTTTVMRLEPTLQTTCS